MRDGCFVSASVLLQVAIAGVVPGARGTDLPDHLQTFIAVTRRDSPLDR